MGPLNIGYRPMCGRTTHGSISLLGETRPARKCRLLLTCEKLSFFTARKSFNASTGCMMHFLGIKNISTWPRKHRLGDQWFLLTTQSYWKIAYLTCSSVREVPEFLNKINSAHFLTFPKWITQISPCVNIDILLWLPVGNTNRKQQSETTFIKNFSIIRVCIEVINNFHEECELNELNCFSLREIFLIEEKNVCFQENSVLKEMMYFFFLKTILLRFKYFSVSYLNVNVYHSECMYI